MPTVRYALDKNYPKRLQISWEEIGLFAKWQKSSPNYILGATPRNIIIKLDDKIVGTIATEKEFRMGREFQLSDGSILKLQLKSRSSYLFYPAEIQVFKNGEPLPDSATDPFPKIKGASLIIFILAGIYLLSGSLESLIIGLAFLVLGFLTMRKSLTAVRIATLLYVIDILCITPLVLFFSYPDNIADAVVKQIGLLKLCSVPFVITFLMVMLQGTTAIQELNNPSNSR